MTGRTIITCCLLLAAAAPALGDEIILKRSVRLRNDATTVSLADVARLEGEHARKWADLELGTLVDGDRPLELTIEDVRRALVAAGANRARFDLSGGTVVVRPANGTASGGPLACTPLSLAKLEGRPTAEVVDPERSRRPRLQQATLDPRAVLTEDSVRGMIAERMLSAAGRSDGPLRLRVELPDATILNLQGGLPSVEPLGTQADGSGTFRILLDGVPQGTATAHLETKVLVHRARHELKRGDTVDVDDVSVLTEWVGLDRIAALDAVGPLIGSRLETRIESRTLLEPRHFVPVVNRNDRIKVRSGGSGWSMELDCIALEDGRPGDTIEVRSDIPDVPARKARTIRVVLGPTGRATLAN